MKKLTGLLLCAARPRTYRRSWSYISKRSQWKLGIAGDVLNTRYFSVL